ITYRDYAGQQVPFLKLFGMDEDAPIDQIDAVQIYQPGRDVFGGISQDGQIGGTYIVFPTLRPFAEPPPVPSIGLSADDARAILAADSNAVIYEDPDPLNREGGGRFRLNLKYRVRLEGLVSQFNLGAFGIREGSERILVDGVPLVRGQDYTIDYDIGQVVLTNPQAIFGTNPNAQIRATYEQKSLFQIAPTSVFGMSTRYSLGTRGELNFMGLYQAERALVNRPQLGLEPGSIFLGGASGRMELGGALLDRVLSRVPGLRVGSASAVNLTGELAMSLPNPNTQGDTYLDDFEATDEIPIFLDRHFWRLGSRPGDPAGAEAFLPLPLDVQTAARIVWQDLVRTESGPRGPLPPDAIDRQIQVAGGRLRETVMYLTFGDTLDPADQRRWRSITTVLSTTGRDMTRSEYLEFYVLGPPQSDHALIIDIGAVSEDAFYYDSLGATAGTYPDGRPWGLGILDEEARLAENEIWNNQEHDARGLWNQPCQATANETAYPLGDERANCARGNGRVDTEDLDGNGTLQANDGAYFRYVVPLDGTSPYLVRDTLGTGTPFALYRIPLRAADRIAVNGATEGTWRFIKHLRMTVTGRPGGLALARMRIIGSRWIKRDVHGILAGPVSSDPGLGAALTRFEVGPVSRLTDGAAYQSPPGVRDQLQDPTQSFTIGGTEYNEKGMRLAYTDLEPDERAEIYFRYAQEPRNFLSYRQLRLWAVARTGNWGPQGGERLQVKLGTDKRNYYLFQTRLNPSLNGGAVTTDAWRPEVVIDFERWMALRSEAEELLITAPPPPGEPLVLWSEDSTYAVVLEERGRAPNLAAVREIGLAVYNAGGAPATGEVWLNDMRLGGAVRDPGYAGQVNLEVRGGDFINTSLSFSSQGALFRQLNQEASYQRSADLSVSTTAQLGNLLPAAWGLSMPVSVSHARTSMDPTFLDRTDVRADRLHGLRRTGSERTRVGVALSKRTPTANPLLSLLVDGVALRFGYNTTSTGTATTESGAQGVDGGLSYGRQLAARELDIMPGIFEDALRALLPRAIENSELFRRITGARLRWSPASINFSTSYFSQYSESYRYDGILETSADALVKPTESRRRGLENDARIAFQPFQSLTADLTVTSSRDLLAPQFATSKADEQAAIMRARSTVAGMDIGWERSRTMSTRLDFRPTVAAWLRPGFTVSTRFSTDRNPSYIEKIELDGDSVPVLQRNFNADRQVARTLQID
ncbi:MAG TPA: cell surface protein SprA, partial [Woeseiaceae bacterium]|nr:cell surface protein SprA [Woeseiaceae bacterium]